VAAKTLLSPLFTNKKMLTLSNGAEQILSGDPMQWSPQGIINVTLEKYLNEIGQYR